MRMDRRQLPTITSALGQEVLDLHQCGVVDGRLKRLDQVFPLQLRSFPRARRSGQPRTSPPRRPKRRLLGGEKDVGSPERKKDPGGCQLGEVRSWPAIGPASAAPGIELARYDISRCRPLVARSRLGTARDASRTVSRLVGPARRRVCVGSLHPPPLFFQSPNPARHREGRAMPRRRATSRSTGCMSWSSGTARLEGSAEQGMAGNYRSPAAKACSWMKRHPAKAAAPSSSESPALESRGEFPTMT